SGGSSTSWARSCAASAPVARCAWATRSRSAFAASTRPGAGWTWRRWTRRRRARLAREMTKAKSKKRKLGAGDVASNRYASYRYELLERLECGMVLAGTEVKSLRTSGAQLKDGYVSIRDNELWLHSVHIPPYGPAARENHEPERARKLLAHRREIDRL